MKLQLPFNGFITEDGCLLLTADWEEARRKCEPDETPIPVQIRPKQEGVWEMRRSSDEEWKAILQPPFNAFITENGGLLLTIDWEEAKQECGPDETPIPVQIRPEQGGGFEMRRRSDEEWKPITIAPPKFR